MSGKITPIGYVDAANLLEVKQGTISNAVSRGVLTALPRRTRKPGRLALEQVQLFKGKLLTLSELDTEDAIIWHEVTRIVTGMSNKTTSKPLDMNAQALAIIADIIERVADLAVDTIVELQGIGAANLTPDKIVSAILNSKSFNQVSMLLGLDLTTVPAQTMDGIQEILQNTITSTAFRLAALQLETVTKSAEEKIAC